MTSSQRLPNALMIGAQKSATRWLRDNLGEHPDVHAHPRETEFFNHHWQRGLNWYRREINAPMTVRVVLETTPGYMMWTDDPVRVAARIDGALPGVRLLALIRNPVDRAISAYIHHARMGRIADELDLFDLVNSVDPETDPLGLVSGGWYGRSLEPYRHRFRTRLAVLLHDEVLAKPRGTYRMALAHFGVEDRWAPDSLGEIKYSNRPDVEPWILERSHLTEPQRQEIWDAYFEDDIRHLESSLQLDLARWRAVDPEAHDPDGASTRPS